MFGAGDVILGHVHHHAKQALRLHAAPVWLREKHFNPRCSSGLLHYSLSNKGRRVLVFFKRQRLGPSTTPLCAAGRRFMREWGDGG